MNSTSSGDAPVLDLPFRAFRVVRTLGKDSGIRKGILSFSSEGVEWNGRGVLPLNVRWAIAICLGVVGCGAGLIAYFTVLDWWVLRKERRAIPWNQVQEVWVDEELGTLYLVFHPAEEQWRTYAQGFRVERSSLQASATLLERLAGDKLSRGSLPKQRPLLLLAIALLLLILLVFGLSWCRVLAAW